MRPSPETLAELERTHTPWQGRCDDCSTNDNDMARWVVWPCDAASLLAYIRDLERQQRRMKDAVVALNQASVGIHNNQSSVVQVPAVLFKALMDATFVAALAALDTEGTA